MKKIVTLLVLGKFLTKLKSVVTKPVIVKNVAGNQDAMNVVLSMKDVVVL